MAIFPIGPKPIGPPANRFVTRGSGSVRKAGSVVHVPNSAHTHSMLAQASRVPRLANISSVSAMLKAHAAAAPAKRK